MIFISAEKQPYNEFSVKTSSHMGTNMQLSGENTFLKKSLLNTAWFNPAHSECDSKAPADGCEQN